MAVVECLMMHAQDCVLAYRRAPTAELVLLLAPSVASFVVVPLLTAVTHALDVLLE